MQLAHNHTFGTVNDELSAAHHDRQVTKVHLLFMGLLSVQPKPNSKRSTVGESQLTTFLTGIARLTEFVTQVLKRSVPIVTTDGENLSKNRLQTTIVTLSRICIGLQKGSVRHGLKGSQIR
jgi:hypothetical protein